jgi:2-desacetyl-2-hydroxyethyl bacteriochlorophyllide A dehydrogenase
VKAASLTEPYCLKTSDRPVPEITNSEVLVRITATAICGTDIGIYKGDIAAKYPLIQGHESVGIVEETGKNVERFKRGDHIIINPAYFCGDCFYCAQGLENLCKNGGLIGRDRDGSFAEYLSISEKCLIALPQSISFEDGTTLQSLATVLRGWERLESIRTIKESDTVVVLGLGTPGLLSVRLAVLAGARNVFALTRSDWKLDIASGYGGIPVNPRRENLEDIVLDATEGRGADVVIECAGSPTTFVQAIKISRPGAVILPFGVQHTIENLNLYDNYYKELTIIGTRAMNNRGYSKAIELYEEGSFDLHPLITDRFVIDDVQERFDRMDRESGQQLRMVCFI